MTSKSLATCLQAGLIAVVASMTGTATTATAADWPQWRGPNRDGISEETGLLQEWPEEGPKLLWQVDDLGGGYGAPSVVDGKIYLVVNEGLEQESVKSLDANGKELWSTPIGKVGNPDQQPNYPAARSTPTVVGNLLYALGSDGDLTCLETATGKMRWQKSLRSDFGGAPGEWAYAESPLVDGDLVVVAPGGADAAIVALNRETGDLVWKSAVPGSEAAGYASVVIAEVEDVKQYVAFLGMGLVGVDAETGEFRWLYEQTKGIANSATPVVHDGYIYSGAFRGGGGLVRLKPEQDGAEVEQVYHSPRLPIAQGGFVVVGDYLYGGGGQTFMCIDFKSGEVQWEERIPAASSVCYADGRLYLHAENGDVLLVEANPEMYREHGRFSPPNQPDRGQAKAWAYPVIADGRLYIRDLGTLWCYDIRE